MLARILITIVLAFGAHEYSRAAEASYEQVELSTDDGIVIYGDRYRLAETHATLLLFHQAGSNARAEYEPIIPHLLALGFGVLAIDQRSGGQRYGQYNRTVAENPIETSYCDVAADLEAALDWIKLDQPGDRIVLWGSSYSAALAIRLAASRPEDVAGVMAFSPGSGGPMAECRGDPFFDELDVPLLILRPSSEAAMASVAEQLDHARKSGHATYVAERGMHGSSMLVEERVGADVTENWSRVEAFLERLVRH